MKLRIFTFMTLCLLQLNLLTAQEMTPAQGMLPATPAKEDASAEEKGIVFSELSFSEALQKAKAENKLLFVDCFTTWCGPCRMLSKVVFKDSLFADYFNRHFVNLKMDMEKGEGPSLKKKYEVRAYPTLLFLNPEGEVVNRLMGADKASVMLKMVKMGIESGGLSGLQKRYEGGERDSAFICGYIDVLSGANMEKEAGKVAADFLIGKEAEMLTSDPYFSLFYMNVHDVNSTAFQYVAKHKKDFCNQYSDIASSLDRRLLEDWISCSYAYMKMEQSICTLDEPGLKTYLNNMKQGGVVEADCIIENVRLRKDGIENQWGSFAKRAEKLLASKTIFGSDDFLLKWANWADKSCADKVVREKVARWCDEACKKLAKKDEVAKKDLPPGVIPAVSMVNYSSKLSRVAERLRKPMEQKE